MSIGANNNGDSSLEHLKKTIATFQPSYMQQHSQDFCFGGGHPVHFPSYLRGPTAFSGGGGIFRDLGYRIRSRPLDQLPDQIKWGGGVVPDIFPVNRSITFPRFSDIFATFSGHLRITRRLWTLTEIQAHFPALLTHSNHVTVT